MKTASNNTSVEIGPDISTVQSKIKVENAPAILRDIDIQTFITHSYSGDMEISLTSPQGTTIVLKRSSPQGSYANVDDPGVVGFKRNVFNGTVWDDSASTTAMDNLYEDDVPSGPLAPEGPLSAFIGENPNGDWILKVKDVTAGDGGQVKWNLTITGLNAQPPLLTMPPVGLSTSALIDNGNPASRTQEITVAGAQPYLWDVDLITGIDHSAPADLDITLKHVATGRTVTISSDNGSTNQEIFDGTRWDDGSKANPSPAVTAFDFQSGVTAVRLAPEKALAAFIGLNPNGKWQLTVTDDTPDADGGTLKNWSLVIAATKGCDTPPVTPPVTPPATTPPAPIVLPPATPPVTITKLAPRGLGVALSTKRDRTSPFAFTVSGALKPPTGTAICAGKVRVTVKAGKKVVTSRTVTLRMTGATGATCTYRATFSLKRKPATLPTSGKVTVSARFLGTARLTARGSKTASVRLG